MRLELPPAPASVRQARIAIHDALSHHGYEGDVDAVVMAASELVTNSVVHAHTDIVVSMFFDRQHVSVTVHDDTTTLPITREPTRGEVGGRGLRLVDELSDSWGSYEDVDGGKSVWCILTAAGFEDSEQ